MDEREIERENATKRVLQLLEEWGADSKFIWFREIHRITDIDKGILRNILNDLKKSKDIAETQKDTARIYFCLKKYYKKCQEVEKKFKGKTTMLKLMLGFYNPVEGDILVGDTNLRNLSLKVWRQKIGVVMQDGYIFPDTIANNIAPGVDVVDRDISGAVIENAILLWSLINAFDVSVIFITHLSEGVSGISHK